MLQATILGSHSMISALESTERDGFSEYLIFNKNLSKMFGLIIGYAGERGLISLLTQAHTQYICVAIVMWQKNGNMYACVSL